MHDANYAPVKLMFFQSRRGAYGRLISAAGVLTAVVLAGATAYFVVGEGRWSWFDCFYMTIITLSTVGFAETLEGMNEMPEARAVTISLIILGSGTLLYFISSLTALIVEGDLQGILRRRSMQRAIDKLNQHVIVCGIGTTGRHIATELRAVAVPFVVLDTDRSRLEELSQEFNDALLYVIGDATDDHVLELAGIERARGVISALGPSTQPRESLPSRSNRPPKPSSAEQAPIRWLRRTTLAAFGSLTRWSAPRPLLSSTGSFNLGAASAWASRRSTFPPIARLSANVSPRPISGRRGPSS